MSSTLEMPGGVGNGAKRAWRAERHTGNRRQPCARHSSAAAARACGGPGVSREALRACSSFEDLHAMVTPLTHGKEPLPINDNTGGTAELAVAAAPAADGSNMGAVAVPQHLHAVIV